MKIDMTTTIDIETLKRFPTYELPSSQHLQLDPGNGCAGDPPGYPTYFTRSIYTMSGNEPQRGPQMVITHEGVHYVVQQSDDWNDHATWGQVREKRQARMHRLYKPLPIEHPRVRAWILSTMMHHRHCYSDINAQVKPFEYGRPALLIYPVTSYELKHFRDDPRFSNEWRMKEQTAVAQYNAELTEKYRQVCTVDNHQGVRIIRQTYPNWTPHPALLSDDALAIVARPGDWWERHDEQPTAAECALTSGGRRDYLRHRSGWCQFCGHTTEER